MEEEDLEAEVVRLEEEYGFGVQHIGLCSWSETSDTSSKRIFVDLTTLEGVSLLVELSVAGWQVRGATRRETPSSVVRSTIRI